MALGRPRPQRVGRRRARSAILAVAAAGAAGGLVWFAVLAPRSADPAVPVREPGVSARRRAQIEASIRRGLPPEQRAAARDGTVTTAEYRSAVQAAMACVRDRLVAEHPSLGAGGVRFEGPERTADGFSFGYAFSLADPTIDPRPVDRACQQRHSAGLESLYHLARRADPAYRARAAAAFGRCLDRAHLPGDRRAGPRHRFVALIQDPTLTPAQTAAARRCIGAHPSIGDLDL